VDAFRKEQRTLCVLELRFYILHFFVPWLMSPISLFSCEEHKISLNMKCEDKSVKIHVLPPCNEYSTNIM
jgi:hypothetical protein